MKEQVGIKGALIPKLKTLGGMEFVSLVTSGLGLQLLKLNRLTLTLRTSVWFCVFHDNNVTLLFF